MEPLPNHLLEVKIDQHRLLASLHESCQFGCAHAYGSEPTETGMARLSLNDDDRQVREWFMAQGRSLGFEVFVDAMGNIFMIRPGRRSSEPPIMMGSHLDTQPTGGRYDGILGVLSGLEVLRTLRDHEVETERSIGVVNWTNEEGARFPIMAVSSGVWAEAISQEKAWNLQEIENGHNGGQQRATMREELERIGFLGPVSASYKANPFAAHFELHIEQGPILEEEGQSIGVVKGVQAFKWFEITVSGRDSHAGTTPLASRKDPVLCAAKAIVASNDIARELGGLATTGIIRAEPGTINTMAHTVKFTLDIRHTRDADLAQLERACRDRFEQIATKESSLGCVMDWEQLVDSPAVQFDAHCIEAVRQSAASACPISSDSIKQQLPWRYMISGAGHDSCYTNRRCPTSMIFTPTREGISHNPREYCAPEHCALGAQVLAGAVLRYDRYLAMLA